MELNEKNNTSMTELSRLSAHEVFINGFHLGDRFMAESLKPLSKKDDEFIAHFYIISCCFAQEKGIFLHHNSSILESCYGIRKIV